VAQITSIRKDEGFGHVMWYASVFLGLWCKMDVVFSSSHESRQDIDAEIGCRSVYVEGVASLVPSYVPGLKQGDSRRGYEA